MSKNTDESVELETLIVMNMMIVVVGVAFHCGGNCSVSAFRALL